MEGQTCGYRKSACSGRCAGRLDAREIIHMDTHPYQPASCLPEEQRPLQETPEPDDDPTREWRERWKKKKANE